ncbi:MAG: sortase [Hahellaceae bacterium]|jgi:sortase A|nr:sortase [Hahellaceae bacterium]
MRLIPLNRAPNYFPHVTGFALGLGLLLLVWGCYIPLKACLAQFLLDAAWERAQQHSEESDFKVQNIQPWPDADMYPVGKLQRVAHAEDWIVVGGGPARNLAFAPVWAEQSVRPGEPGIALISGHKDTQFGALRTLTRGDLLRWTRADGSAVDFIVRDTAIVNATESRLALEASGPARLVLVTCFPFDDSYGGPLRYLVLAEALPASPIVSVAGQ